MPCLPKWFENSWAFKAQSFCFTCFQSTLESDSFTHHTLPLCEANAKASYLAFRWLILGSGIWHICLLGKQKDSEVTD